MFKVGDIIHSSYGYNMTTPSFYEVLSVTPTGGTVTIRELQQDVVTGNAGYSGTCIPILKAYRGDLMKRRNGNSIKISEVARGYLWDNKPVYFNYMD